MITAKKSLGQHFLSDRRVVQRIIGAVLPQLSDTIIEIGPGTGAITSALAHNAGFVLGIEADPRLVAELGASLKSSNVSILEGDVLSMDWDSLIDKGITGWISNSYGAGLGEPKTEPRVRITGNLPYYISTRILQLLVQHHRRVFDITVMLQNEVVDRIASPAGSREYGYLSVLVQFYCEVEKLFQVPPSAFRPAPEVDSAVVRLTSRSRPAVAVENEERYFAVVRASFAHRRKTILNNLKAAASALRPSVPLAGALANAGIDPRARAESLSLHDFARLCDSLYKSAT